MEWLNYHHLLYFWVVAKHGSITQASKELHLAHPTISGQLRRLEEVLGEKLFARKGRNLVLTDSGRIAAELRRRYKIEQVGRARGLRQRFYAISVERKIRNPAVAAICQIARKHIFA